LVIDCHIILARWGNDFCLVFDVHGVSDVRPTYINTAEPLAPEPSAFEFDMAIEESQRNKSPGINQIPAELIKAGVRKIRSEIHKLINSIWNKEELLEEWKE